MRISWEAVSALSAVIGLVLVVAGSLIALSQFRESLSSRQLQAILGLIEQLQSSEVRSARAVLARHRKEIVATLDTEDGLRKLDSFLEGVARDGSPASVTELRKVFAVLEFIAMLSLHGQIPAAVERAYLAPTFAAYWDACRPVVLSIRRYSRGGDIYLQHFEAFIDLTRSGHIFHWNARTHKKRTLRMLAVRGRAAASLRLS